MTTNSSTSSTARKVAVACGSGLLLLGAGACGSAAGGTTGNAASGEQPQTQSFGGGPGGQGGFPGADGKIAAVSGSTAQVQSRSNGQVAVTWNGSTTFTKQVAASLAGVKVGSCVMVLPTSDTASSGDAAAATTVAAAAVTVTQKTGGTCTGGFGGRGPAGQAPKLDGQGPGGGQLPEGGAPGGNGSARPQLRGFGGAFGEVTAVSATGFTVKSSRPSGTEETNVTVTVSGTTTYTATAQGAASDVKVGLCMRANGTADDSGAITATTVALTNPTNGECGGMLVRTNGGPAAGTAQES